MDTFYITITYIPRVCFIILYVVLVGYLLSLNRKSTSTWWLIAFCCLFCTVDIGWDLTYLIPWTQMDPSAVHLMFALGQGLFIPAAGAYLQLAYTFRGNPYPRESRVLLVVSGLLGLSVLLSILFTPSYLSSPLLEMIQIGALLLFMVIILWAGVVFLRKMHLFSKDAAALDREPPPVEKGGGLWGHFRAPRGRSAEACRAFAGLSVLLCVVVFGGMMVWAIGVFPEVGIQVYWGGYIIFLYMLLVLYVNYAPEPTTLQVKLVGAALATLLLFVAVLTQTLFPGEVLLSESGLSTPAPQTLWFEPEGPGTYVVTTHPPRFEAAVGTPLEIEKDRHQAVSLAFPFPFYGAPWDSFYINENGWVSQGALTGIDLSWSILPIFSSQPLISPLGLDLETSEGGEVYYLSTQDSAVVTWYELTLAGSDDRHTAQLVLYPTGSFAFHYGSPGGGAVATRADWLGLRGIQPGGEAAVVHELPRVLEGPVRSTAGAALIEDYSVQYYRYLEQRGWPLFILVVMASLFIVFVFPFVFRRSLLNPLDRLLAGVQRIEKGETDTVVAVEVEDEVGTLTQHFNHMAYVIRQAERQLKDYADTLEHKVEARTAELAQSLDDLKRTQAQLIQAEKMASLGALTAGIAHEIKNPLNFVNNFAQLAVELTDDIHAELEAANGYFETDRGAELEELLSDLKLNVEKIEKHGRRADGIVQGMLRHARGSEGERRPTNVNALLEEYLNLTYHGMRAHTPDFHVTLERAFDETVGEVQMVPQEIGRVLMNLLDNAFYAVHRRATSQEGGYGPTVRVATRRREKAVEIRVEDNGEGIAEALRDKIFEPFYTTKPTGQGNTGLGLSLSYDIVTQGHGGRFTVESEEGKGATFMVTLPVDQQEIVSHT